MGLILRVNGKVVEPPPGGSKVLIELGYLHASDTPEGGECERVFPVARLKLTRWSAQGLYLERMDEPMEEANIREVEQWAAKWYGIAMDHGCQFRNSLGVESMLLLGKPGQELTSESVDALMLVLRGWIHSQGSDYALDVVHEFTLVEDVDNPLVDEMMNQYSTLYRRPVNLLQANLFGLPQAADELVAWLRKKFPEYLYLLVKEEP